MATVTATVLQQPRTIRHSFCPQHGPNMSTSSAGTSTAATGSSRPTTSATGGVGLDQSPLCLVCKGIFDGLTPRNEYGEVNHYGLEALFTSAGRGCQLCMTVSQSIDPEQWKAFQARVAMDERVVSWGYASVSPIARDQARIKFRYLRTQRTEKELYEGLSNSEKRKTRMNMSTPNLSMDSRALSDGSGSSEGGRMRREQMPIVVELILMNPKYAVEPGVRRIGLQSIDTGSAESFDIARKWIDECMFNHMKCSVNEGSGPIWKPTHLLDISVKGPRGAPGVRLVDGMFLDPFTEYVTLSHVWGRSKAIRLHKGTLKALRQGVAASSLPRTFAEAAMAADRLGYRYLWIDALCIMHDNEQAVLTEISNMDKIYSSASLNLAATSSRDDASGLVYPRNVHALQPCVVDAIGLGIQDGLYKILRSTVWHDLVDTSPLAKRAWCFQERCLAKRTLHFTRTELLWECQQMCCSEVFPKGLPATMSPSTSTSSTNTSSFNLNTTSNPPDPFNKRTHHQRHGNWPALIALYSTTRMSYTSDKLLALSGLARQYMTRNRLRPTDYVCGLWKPHLPASLLWRTDKGKRPLRYRAPSWSWASIEGDIGYAESVAALLQQQHHPGASGGVGQQNSTCLEVIAIEASYKLPNDTFGQLDSPARLKVRGFMARGLLPRTKDYWGHVPCEIRCKQATLEVEEAWFDEDLPKLSDPEMMSAEATEGGGGAGVVQRRRGMGMVEHLQVYLLVVVDVVERVEGLILCSNIKRGEFRRIGTWAVEKREELLMEGLRKVMKGDEEMGNYEERLDHVNGYAFASDYTYGVTLV